MKSADARTDVAAKVAGSGAVDRLRDFLENDMSMSHVYQPLMIRTILDGGGAATRRQIAAAFLAADLSQLEYYEQIVRGYPTQVLRRRGVIEHHAGVYRLAGGFDRLEEWQRATLIAVCDAKVADFVGRRQAKIWRHRGRNADALPGTLRWRIIRRAMGQCEACGIGSDERALEVDHIVPRSKGGSNDEFNLQALCGLCNVQKLDRDETDFHAARAAASFRQPDCPFCDPVPRDGSPSNRLAFVADTEDGSVVAPRRHGVDYIGLWQSEANALRELEIAVSTDSDHRGIVIGMVSAMRFARDGDIGHLGVVLTRSASAGAR
jgi:ATP adenylyltransferase